MKEMVLTEVPSAHVLDKESRVVVPGPLTCGSFKVTLTLTDQVPKQLGLKVDNSDERGSMIMGITEGVVEHFNLQESGASFVCLRSDSDSGWGAHDHHRSPSTSNVFSGEGRGPTP